MGEKGAKLTRDAEQTVGALLTNLDEIDGISSKKMFGGYGVFCKKKMFAMVTGTGECYLKLNEDNQGDFEKYGAPKHGRMPYGLIPEKILGNKALLVEWANKAIAPLLS